MSKICKKCNHSNEKSAKFCAKCGDKLNNKIYNKIYKSIFIILILLLSTLLIIDKIMLEKARNEIGAIRVEETKMKKLNIDFIKNLNYTYEALEKDTFETDREFKSRNEEAQNVFEKNIIDNIKFYIKTNNIHFGEAKMLSYDAEKHLIKLSLTWNDKIDILKLKIKKRKEIILTIYPKDAKNRFGDNHEYPFNIEIKYENHKLVQYIHLKNIMILIDNKMWQNLNYSNEKRYNWYEAIAYCETSTLGGYHDWRLPRKDELETLLTRERLTNLKGDNFYIREEFLENISGDGYRYFSSGFWTRTERFIISEAWVVFFDNGYDFWDFKTYSYFVRCVR